MTQLVSNNLKLSINSEFRKIYTNYSIGVSWLPARFSHHGLEISLTGNRWVYPAKQPGNYSVALQAIFSLEKRGIGLTYCSVPMASRNVDLTAWTANPAVHINTVQISPEQNIVTQAASPPPHINSVSMTNISHMEPPVDPLLITGSNFLSGAQIVMSEGMPLATQYVDSTLMKFNAPGLGYVGDITVTVVNPDGQASNAIILHYH